MKNQYKSKMENDAMRITENGLTANDKVKFDLAPELLKQEFPDFSLDETYTILRVFKGFEMHDNLPAVTLLNSKNEKVGFVRPTCLIKA